MQEAQITVLSLRKDGTAFKTDLPGIGEQWVKIPPTMKGLLEWKGSYHIGWVKVEKDYFLQQLINGQTSPPPPAASQPSPVGHNRPPPNGNGHGIDRELRIAALAYANHLGPILAAQSDNFTGARYEHFARHLHFKSLIAVHLGEKDYVEWLATAPVEQVEDTF
jgi:hypothetical protein